jgi:hypothetical protein
MVVASFSGSHSNGRLYQLSMMHVSGLPPIPQYRSMKATVSSV